nr:AraC family transcriptional regulator [Paenibacillus alkalitolerans]
MVYPIMKTIVRKGYDVEQFCSYAPFDAGLLQDAEARIPAEELERLMIKAAEFTQDGYFGLHQGKNMEFADLGIVGYVMMHSGSVADALQAYRRYYEIVCSDYMLDWEEGRGEVKIRLFMKHPGQMSRHCAEDMACLLYRLIGKLSTRQIPLSGIQFSHDAPSDASPYLTVFGRIPEFGAKEHVLCMSKDVMRYPVMYSDPKLLQMFESVAKATRDGLMQANTLSDQVYQWLKQSLPNSFPTLRQTAAYFGVSARTLQSKLKEENTSYNDLSVRVRKEMAVDCLMKFEYSVGDIAYVLHFSEPSAFQNAFKKWTGLTPGQYRAKIKGERSETSVV